MVINFLLLQTKNLIKLVSNYRNLNGKIW